MVLIYISRLRSLLGHSRPRRASSISGHVRFGAESGSKLRALAAPRHLLSPPLPPDEECGKRAADAKRGDDRKNDRRVSGMVHEASDQGLPEPRTCIGYEVEQARCGP